LCLNTEGSKPINRLGKVLREDILLYCQDRGEESIHPKEATVFIFQTAIIAAKLDAESGSGKLLGFIDLALRTWRFEAMDEFNEMFAFAGPHDQHAEMVAGGNDLGVSEDVSFENRGSFSSSSSVSPAAFSSSSSVSPAAARPSKVFASANSALEPQQRLPVLPLKAAAVEWIPDHMASNCMYGARFSPWILSC
jgi:hypothetical protein